MSDVRVRKLQEFIKQEVSQMLMRGLKDPRICLLYTSLSTLTRLNNWVLYCLKR